MIGIREFCGDGLEPHKDRHSRWVLLVYYTNTDSEQLTTSLELGFQKA